MLSISAEELKTRLEGGQTPVMLDVREEWEFEICNIAGSVNISMSDTDKMLKTLNPDDETIVICHHGMRSFQVASFLKENGFNNIMNLEGGVDSWAKTVDSTMAQY
ncbi:MAG: sulfurtransferase [Proteobacteria bacterium]|nr:sulfurtransferase [Pseudomonadota bacterium]